MHNQSFKIAMSKKAVFAIIILNLIITFIAVLLLAGYASAKLTTIPWLSRFKIFNPQSPIVINRREEVRVSDSADVQQAAASIRSRLSTLATVQDGVVTPVANLVNLTSDGYFMTAKTAVNSNEALFVVTADGRNARVTQIVSDPASGVALLKASLTDMPVAPFADSSALEVGQKVIAAHATFANFGLEVRSSFITRKERDASSEQLRSDYRSRRFGLQSLESLMPGEAIANLNGDIVGLWDGVVVVPTSVLSRIQQLFFEDKQTIERVGFGFEYRTLTEAEADIAESVPGALVTAVGPDTPALTAGLQAGDVVVRAAGEQVSEQRLLEEILDTLQPNETIPFVVSRDGKEQALSLRPAILR